MSRAIYIIRCIYVFSDRDNGDPNLLSGKLDRPHNTPPYLHLHTFIRIYRSEWDRFRSTGCVPLSI